MNNFQLSGIVKRKFTSEKFGAVTLVHKDGEFTSYYELKAFDPMVISTIKNIQEGEAVEVTGKIKQEKLTEKDPASPGGRKEVYVGGYKVYVPMFQMTDVRKAGSTATLNKDDDSDF